MKKINNVIAIIFLLASVSLISCGDDESTVQLSVEAQLEVDIDKIESYIAANSIQNVKNTSTGLHYVITKAGSGSNAVVGSNVSVHYTGKFLNGGSFDSSVGANPIAFKLGTGRVIPGWDEGLQAFNTGSEGTLFIPSNLAYGTRGAGSIGPNEVLIFDIEMVSIN